MHSARPRAVASRQMAEGRAWGSFFFTGFGAIWLLLGLRGMHSFTPVTGMAVALVCGGTLAAGIGLAVVAQRLPSLPLPALEQARVDRLFRAVNIIQWVSILTAVAVLILLRQPEYIPLAIGIIVGLHLYPLAGAFRNPIHTVTGTFLISWCTACIMLLSRQRVAGIGSFGTGVILMGSAAVSLTVVWIRVRHTASAIQHRAPLLTR